MPFHYMHAAAGREMLLEHVVYTWFSFSLLWGCCWGQDKNAVALYAPVVMKFKEITCAVNSRRIDLSMCIVVRSSSFFIFFSPFFFWTNELYYILYTLDIHCKFFKKSWNLKENRFCIHCTLWKSSFPDSSLFIMCASLCAEWAWFYDITYFFLWNTQSIIFNGIDLYSTSASAIYSW